MFDRKGICRAAGLLAVLLIAQPSFAQAPSAADQQTQAPATDIAGLWLTTPHPEFTVTGGGDIVLPLTLRNDNLPAQRVALSVAGLPDGWTAGIRGGGHDVTAAMVLPGESRTMNVEIVPGPDATLGTYDFEISAAYDGGSVSLPISMTLVAGEAGEVRLEPELPGLRGTPRSTFSFKVDVANLSEEDALFTLTADTGDGFTTTFKRGFGSEEITGLPVAAGDSETVTIEVRAVGNPPAGEYPVRFGVLSGELSATTDLTMVVTGSPQLALAGPQERLSGEAVAGQATTFPFTVENTGTAAANEITLAATAPQGWTVEFSPDRIAALEAGAVQEVGATVRPAEQAIAGDYVTTIRANASGASTSAQFRVTVNTSTLWGVVGLAVIAAAVLVLALAVLRYGRR